MIDTHVHLEKGDEESSGLAVHYGDKQPGMNADMPENISRATVFRDYAKIRKITGASYDKNTSTWIFSNVSLT